MLQVLFSCFTFKNKHILINLMLVYIHYTYWLAFISLYQHAKYYPMQKNNRILTCVAPTIKRLSFRETLNPAYHLELNRAKISHNKMFNESIYCLLYKYIWINVFFCWCIICWESRLSSLFAAWCASDLLWKIFTGFFYAQIRTTFSMNVL